MKKLLSLVLALAMVLLCVGAAMAANTAAEPSGTYAVFKTTDGATITISNANKGQKYEFYQIFEAIPNTTTGTATNVSYKMIGSASMPENNYFKVDDGGNVVLKGVEDPETHEVTYAAKDTTTNELTSGAIAWLNSVKTSIGRKVAEVTPTEAGSQVMQNLPFGYYFISTTTGTVVTVDSTMPTASVTDKNPPTTIDKEITGVGAGSVSSDQESAIAQVGTVVNFEVRIPIENGAVNYRFEDKMSHGLTLGSTVTVKLETPAHDETPVSLSDAIDADTYAEGNPTMANNETDGQLDIYIAFKNSWLTANVGKTIVINYTGTVNSTAVIAGENPNEATIKWGDISNPLTATDEVKVYPARITVTKEDASHAALEGATFILKKNSDNTYYINTNGIVSWGALADATPIAPAQAENPETHVKSGPAVASFDGLPDGTYTLIEKDVPQGYNRAADTTWTIKPATAVDPADANNLTTDLTLTPTVTNNQGTELPSTGGIGTTIFYILGGLLVVGAAVILVARRKASED